MKWIRPGHEVPDSGELGHHRLAEVLHHCARDKRTGVLSLLRGEHRKDLFVIGGMPVYVESSLQHETLGAYLLHHSIIDAGLYQQALEIMRRTRRDLTDVLMEMGALAAGRAYQHTVAHLSDKVINAFAWTDGTYRFEPRPGFEQDVVIAWLNPCTLVVDGLRKHFSRSNLPPEFAAREAAACFALDAAAYDEERLGLSVELARVRRKLESRLPLGEVAEVTGLDHREVMGVAYALFILQVIGFTDQAKEPEGQRRITVLPPEPEPASITDEDDILADYLRLKPMDHLTLLGIALDCSDDEVERAYRERRARYEPVARDESSPVVQQKAQELLDKIDAAFAELRTASGRQEHRQRRERRGKRRAAPTAQTTRGRKLSAEFYFQSGTTLLEQEQFQNAAWAFAQCLREVPTEPAYLGHHAWALYRADPEANRAAAIEELRTAVSTDPSYAPALYFRGRIAELEGADEDAIEHYRAAVRADPQHEDARRHLQAVSTRAKHTEGSLPGKSGRWFREEK
jgi:tetratricopeptide (TPR) repeat protein